MIVLATGDPTFDVADDRVILSIPSGKESVQIALCLSNLMLLDHRAHKVLVEFLEDQHTPKPQGDVVQFPAKRRKARRA